jgi:hypothetical protein
MTTRKGKQSEGMFPLNLTIKQRESLVHATRITRSIATRIKEAPHDKRFVEFTRKELEKIETEIDTSLDYATPDDRKRLHAVIDKIDDLLVEIEDKAMTERRYAVHKSGAIYQFKVVLKDSNPPIWRRIQVPDCTLGELHQILQAVMGWEYYHLHQFIIRGDCYGTLDPEDMFWDEEMHNEEGTSISQVVKGGRKVRFTYEYDFGDSWQHEIVLEKTLEPEPQVKYPRCLEGERACPPEDVGGIWGYAEFLEAISDPSHVEHDEMMERVGGEFDPEKFSVDEVNRKLGEDH